MITLSVHGYWNYFQKKVCDRRPIVIYMVFLPGILAGKSMHTYAIHIVVPHFEIIYNMNVIFKQTYFSNANTKLHNNSQQAKKILVDGALYCFIIKIARHFK